MEADAFATSLFAQIPGLGFLMQSSQVWYLWQLFCPNAITYGFAYLEEDQVETVLQYYQLFHLSWKIQLSSALVEELQWDSARKQESTDSEQVVPYRFVGVIICPEIFWLTNIFLAPCNLN